MGFCDDNTRQRWYTRARIRTTTHPRPLEPALAACYVPNWRKIDERRNGKRWKWAIRSSRWRDDNIVNGSNYLTIYGLCVVTLHLMPRQPHGQQSRFGKYQTSFAWRLQWSMKVVQRIQQNKNIMIAGVSFAQILYARSNDGNPFDRYNDAWFFWKFNLTQRQIFEKMSPIS